ncbi:tRNA (guanosine(37)-N1)-methyltransferase TrmD [Liquorilactobacillus cacaonum]|uniref:tRNA (guanine-N(1)-)-methyltransferase n=1 Tax=Liquorilactobacillus cacaonum DSM 21116 TaxID=1423729 RepID=A0A0R2CGF3_9LACO|nr:tRNA (guanosine(37)-N1)-methyltransferase TrmD [Liquorilactobacillus cacaonum]KRM90712.1 tRNA (guanine-N(1)-)-methyltransferase [Liquorilactobacillus cacaonum DSM 21116]
MRVDILSLFPEMFKGPLQESIIGKAIEKEIIDVEITNYRNFTKNKQQHVDDYPYGGGAGMLLQAQPIFDALDFVEEKHGDLGSVILLDPAGRQFNQKVAEELATKQHLTFICGHYEGYDERIRERVTDEISLGDYILTGGELGAMVIIDATVRLLQGTLGNDSSAIGDSFSTGLLEYPQYTRPASYRGMEVPEVLTSGNHQKIAQWREYESLKRTFLRRPDLLEKLELTKEQEKMLAKIVKDLKK